MTHDELIARAEALAPVLRERAETAAKMRRMPDETMADLKANGFFRVLQPKRFGGYELSPQTLFDLQITLGAACPSTAWVLGVVAVHSWQLALFDEQAQQEVWGEDTDVVISSSYMPVGKVKRVEGGFRFSGRWGFSSGSDHCDWAFLGGFVPVESGPPDMRTFLIPRADYTLEDTWHVSGLKATGSKDVVIDDVFVPEHRTHKLIDGFRCKNPGNAVNDAPLFRLPFGQVFVRSVSTTIIGIAQGMLNEYVALMRGRVSRATGGKAKENGYAQHVAAEAMAVIDGARLVLERNFKEMMADVTAGRSIDLERRIKYRYDSSRTVENCVRVVDRMFTNAGGAPVFLSSPLNRFFQDAHAARAHYANNPIPPGENMGRVAFGLKNTDFFL